MNFLKFRDWWFKPQVELCKQISEPRRAQDLASWWPKMGDGSLSSDALSDIQELEPLLGRKAVFVMDGASYHKRQNDYFVQREGRGSLFGADGVGRHDPTHGWTKERCVMKLFLH